MAKNNSTAGAPPVPPAATETTPPPLVQTSGQSTLPDPSAPKAGETPALPGADAPPVPNTRSAPDNSGKTHELCQLATLNAEELIEIGLTITGQPLRKDEDPLRPGQMRQQRQTPQTPEEPAAATDKPEEPTIEGEVGKAKKRLTETLLAARQARVTDLNVIGQLENAFENAKNALAANKAGIETLEDAAKALKVGAHALANHSGTTPGILSAARDALAATEQAFDQLKA